MKITRKELLKLLQTMIISFAAAAIYYFVYSIDIDSAHTLGALCICGIGFLNCKNKPVFLHKQL